MLDSIFPDSTFATPRTKERAWSRSHRLVLEEIAEECPYEFGIGVYMARAMLSEYDTIPYMGYHECEVVPPPPSGKSGEEDRNDPVETSDRDEGHFNLYPNPNAGEFTVKLSMGETDRVQMTVWSITGQRIYSQRLVSESHVMRLDVTSGLHLYTVQVNDELKWTGKISVSGH